MKTFNILFLGDVVGPDSVEYTASRLWKLREQYKADFAVVNGENCAAGNGIDREGAARLLSGGADIITSGNHVFRRFDADTLLEDEPRVLRPANFPPQSSGAGFALTDAGGFTVLVMNILGVVGLEPLACPFSCADKILTENQGRYDFSILDFHAEATSEKGAMGFYLDGRVTAVIGTHTHVTTADEKILPGGTAFITDAGMCGPRESVLGVEPECIIRKLTLHRPVKFGLSNNPVSISGVVIEADTVTKKAISIRRITA